MEKLKKQALVGFLFTMVLGTLNHFFYEWSGNNPIVATFSAVNESTWEHLKLLVMPMLLFGIWEYLQNRNDVQNFLPARVVSILLGMVTIVTSFYTYMGIVGQHFLWADIGTFVLGGAVAYWFGYKLMQTDVLQSRTAQIVGWLTLLLLTSSFVYFTFFPPQLGLFAVPSVG